MLITYTRFLDFFVLGIVKTSTICLLCFSFLFQNVSFVSAGVVPGTIQKGANFQNIECGVADKSYTSSHSCSKIAQCNCSSCNCTTSVNDDGSETKSCDTCCEEGGSTYNPKKSIYKNFSSNSSTFSYYNGETKLTSDIQTCTPTTVGVKGKISGSSVLSCNKGNCGQGGSGTKYSIKKDGFCKESHSYKTTISSYDQLGNRVYSERNKKITKKNSNPGTNLSAFCEIEGRYATTDSDAPILTFTGTGHEAFLQNNESVSVTFDDGSTGDIHGEDAWCNLKKYWKSDYGKEISTGKYLQPPLNGCEAFKQANSSYDPNDTVAPKNQDLLTGLSFEITDESGISFVQVGIGNCSFTLNKNTQGLEKYMSTDVLDLVKDSNSAQGIHDYMKKFIVNFESETGTYQVVKNADSVEIRGLKYLPAYQEMLLNKITGKPRLDNCLGNGKNYLEITVRDNARGSENGSSYAPNNFSHNYTTGAADNFGYINIDSVGPKAGLFEDAFGRASSPAHIRMGTINPQDADSCVIPGSTTVSPERQNNPWTNESVYGNIQVADGFESIASCDHCCEVLQKTQMCCTNEGQSVTQESLGGVCPDITGNPLFSGNRVWVGPSGVNPNTGEYSTYMCDDYGPFPDGSLCQIGCPAGSAFNVKTNKCESECRFTDSNGVEHVRNPRQNSTDAYSDRVGGNALRVYQDDKDCHGRMFACMPDLTWRPVENICMHTLEDGTQIFTNVDTDPTEVRNSGYPVRNRVRLYNHSASPAECEGVEFMCVAHGKWQIVPDPEDDVTCTDGEVINGVCVPYCRGGGLINCLANPSEDNTTCTDGKVMNGICIPYCRGGEVSYCLVQ